MIANHRKTVAFKLSGRFDAHETPSFLANVEPLFAQIDTDISIDLQDVVFIDSIALSELVSLHKKLYDAGRTLFLTSPADSVRVILEITGLVSLFNVVLLSETETSAAHQPAQEPIESMR
jgi:anti-sigma B factor antagonist